MQILVTGGSGYLGGRLVEYLTQMGHSVKVGGRDIFTDRDSLELACRDITAIVHLAAMNAQDCVKDPEAALLVNGMNSLRLLKMAERSKVSQFIYFSTAHVYGSPLEGELSEESFLRPLHHYSITHRLVEDYILEANVRNKLSGVVFRLTNAVGSPVSQYVNCWMLVVNDLCRQAVVDKKMILHSAETVERDYIPISSVTHVVFSALKSVGLTSGIYNLSSGVSLSLRKLTDLIVDRAEEVLGVRPAVKFTGESKNRDTDQLVVLNSKLKSTGLEIDTNLADEIDQLLINCKFWFGE